VRWGSFKDYLDVLDRAQIAINVVHFVGHGPIRYAAMGAENRAPDARELARMKDLLAEAISAGAFGISSGLVYAPSAYAATDELIALCRSMASRGGQYFTHMRGESDTLLDSINEAIRICEEGGVPLQIAHLKAFGRENWPLFTRALELVEAARSRGLDTTADVYPYTAGSTFLSALLPAWAHDGGHARLQERLGDPAARERMMAQHLTDDGGWRTPQGTMAWDEVMIATCPSPSDEGLTLTELGARRKQPPAEAMLDFLREHDSAVSVVMFAQAESNVQRALRQSYVMIGSDSLGLSCGPGPHPGKPHPRTYGTFPRVLGKYVRDDKLFTIEEAVAKMTGRPAAKLGLRQRGELREGYFADLAVFDPATIRDEATYQDPHRYPSGIPYVVVNGQVMVDGGRFTAHAAGRILKH
jgi:N-acyl-D-aspartate/D-glutamate deacylase